MTQPADTQLTPMSQPAETQLTTITQPDDMQLKPMTQPTETQLTPMKPVAAPDIATKPTVTPQVEPTVYQKATVVTPILSPGNA